MSNEEKLNELVQESKQSTIGGQKTETQAKSAHAKPDSSLPEKEELVTMSKSDLDSLIEQVEQRHNEQIADMKGHVEKLEQELKKREEVSYIKRRGEESLKSKGIEVNQKRPLNPIDRQSKILEEHKDKLKGRRPRFVTNNESIRSLRRAQGYEPVRDEDGNEVRYMDGILMGIPEQRYKEEIEADREYRKSLRRQSLREHLQRQGEQSGVQTFGDIDFDDTPVHNGG